MTHNVVSVSGGKDSTALLLLAIVQEAPNLQAVFADTGHEHQQTYDYVHYLAQATGVPIRWVKADFSEQIARKRLYVDTKWREQGVPDSIVEQALAVLHPTGIPFLDLCLWKGRFPSTRARFCSIELKRNPLIEQVMMPLMDKDQLVLSWQGVRADESLARRCLPECDEVGGGLFNYRPILRWNVSDVFNAHRVMGIEPNPLYLQGMGRVGCMPCIHARKDELLEISKRFPEEVERVSEWERMVSKASKRGSSTLFEADTIPGNSREMISINHDTHGIQSVIQWAMTSRGGRQFDLTRIFADASSCSSIYGLCE
ncbi:phosphoadenosine phosphosulfate reductase family protein [Alcaligenes sp. A-TC2]|uniref:phosphoadenosine phosphosulfate reductase family protein n=1 Tax=Alcaligenes nematophilus TaxID=2994643 RepID=UPI00224F6175|nr:phosphoadenosine phosphosulfate reductase family protein [Alcaligenes nematophilus]MCX5470508.1 phosphoadenosine phosphosulfate reductase family protein [Alcaligenes nematophilus]